MNGVRVSANGSVRSRVYAECVRSKCVIENEHKYPSHVVLYLVYGRESPHGAPKTATETCSFDCKRHISTQCERPLIEVCARVCVRILTIVTVYKNFIYGFALDVRLAASQPRCRAPVYFYFSLVFSAAPAFVSTQSIECFANQFRNYDSYTAHKCLLSHSGQSINVCTCSFIWMYFQVPNRAGAPPFRE